MTEPVALITGAARRIGAAVARDLHAQGYRVALHYRQSGAAARALADELQAQRPGSALTFRADLDDPAAVDGLADAVLAACGGCALLVNNASSFLTSPVGEVTPALWDTLLASNLRAPFFLAQRLAPALTDWGDSAAVDAGKGVGGSIINIVDVHAERPLPGYAVYSIAKAGLAMLTRSLALELAPRVRVNGVAPGFMLPPAGDAAAEADWEQRGAEMLQRIPLARMGDVQDIASAVRWLAAAPYVTGQVLAVDGGMGVVP